jgi:hypothetical protein
LQEPCLTAVLETVERVTGKRADAPTVSEWLEHWIRAEKGALAARPMMRYEQIVRDFLSTIGVQAQAPLEVLSTDTILEFKDLHCVVPGGGLSPEGTQWISCQPGFFLPVRVLSRLFRRLFLEYLVKAFDAAKLQFFSSLESLRDRSSFLDYLAPLGEVEWVAYAKRPFAGPEQVLDYIGRYTHRVAISNNRLLDIAER